MKLTSVAVLLLATAVAGISQQSGEKSDNSKRALQEGNAGVSKRAPAASPQGGIEYAVSKESQAGKLGQQQIYESPGLTKISDILSGHGPGYQAAISSHLYAPLSIYQQRLGSPTYEISAPVASQLAYSEHKIYQVPQNSINYPQTEKLQEKQPFRQYQVLQPQGLIAQGPLLYQQRLIPISQGQPVYQPINALIPPGQQLPQNLQPQLQYQPFPYQQQTPITPDDPIYVGGTQLQPLQLHVQQLLPKGYSSVQLYQNPIPQLPHYNQQQPLVGLLQSFPPAPTLQARPVYQPVQEVQKTQAPVTITVQPPAAYTKQDDLNQRLNLRDLKNTATPQPQQQGAVSYSSLSLGQTNTQYNVQPLKTPQKGQHQQRTVSPLVYQTLQNHPNLILTDNVQQSVLKPLLIHHLTYTKPQLKQIQQQLNEQLQLNLQEQFSLQQQKLNQQQQANQLQQASQLQQAAQQQQAKQQQQVNQQNLVIQQQQLKQQQQLNQQQQTLNQQQQQLNQQQQSGPQLYLNQQQHLTQQQLSPLTYTKQTVTAAPATSQSPSSTTKFLPVQYFGKYAESIFGNFSN